MKHFRESQEEETGECRVSFTSVDEGRPALKLKRTDSLLDLLDNW